MTFVLRVAAILLGAATVALVPVVLLFLAIVLWPVTVAAAIAAVVIGELRVRRHKTSVKAELGQWLMNISLPVRDYLYYAWQLAMRIWSSARPVKNDLVADTMVNILDDSPALVVRFCDTIGLSALRAACDEAGLGRASRVKPTLTTPDGKLVNAGKVAARSSIDRDCERLLREYLRERLQASREVRRSVALRVMSTADVAAMVNRAFEDV
jgi:hypothetical protein